MRHLAQHPAQDERGRGQHRRAAHRFRHGAGEIGVAHRLRAHGVERPAHGVLVFEEMHDQPRHVLDVDQAHPLFPRTEPPAQRQPERSPQEWKCPAVRTHHEAQSHQRDAHADALRAQRRAFPVARDPGEKSAAGRAGFVESFVGAVAVDANGGSVHEQARRARRLAHGVDEQFRRAHAAFAHTPLFAVGPAAHDGFAREVDQRVEAAEIGRRAGSQRARFDASRDGFLRGAGERHAIVGTFVEAADEMPPDETRCAGDADFHAEDVNCELLSLWTAAASGGREEGRDASPRHSLILKER